MNLLRADGRRESWCATAAVETQLELSLLRAGGVIPAILQKMMADAAG